MEELQTFKDQLALVNLQLEADPTNEDLLTLKAEFQELIELTEAANAVAAPKHDKGKQKATASSSAPPAPTHTSNNWQEKGEYRSGMDCMAKYHKDGKWYPAKINAVVGSHDSPLYTITFKGYTTSTNVPLAALRPHDPSAPIPTPVAAKRPQQHADLSDRDKERKKKKGEKWMATQKAKADDARGKQNDWQKFGKKAAKKGIHIAGLEGKSVFKTNDNPAGE